VDRMDTTDTMDRTAMGRSVAALDRMDRAAARAACPISSVRRWVPWASSRASVRATGAVVMVVTVAAIAVMVRGAVITTSATTPTARVPSLYRT